jgi:hypothetical protein
LCICYRGGSGLNTGAFFVKNKKQPFSGCFTFRNGTKANLFTKASHHSSISSIQLTLMNDAITVDSLFFLFKGKKNYARKYFGAIDVVK